MHKKKKSILHLLLIITLFFASIYCIEAVRSDTSKRKKYKTEKVIILVIDGPRYSETWGDSTHRHIPYMADKISKSGVICTQFYNDGYTYTTSGHAAMCTGIRQKLENRKGTQLPDQPSIFQYYLKKA